jgi:uncharacterized protein YggU (UPF0235/DUF167 family)
LELISKVVSIPKSAISIVRGETSRDKTLQIDGISGAELDIKIVAALENSA